MIVGFTRSWRLTSPVLAVTLATVLAVGAFASRLVAADGDGPPPLPWPEAAVRAFDAVVIPEGLVKRIYAAEPLVTDPVAFCIDEAGRLFVAETFRQERGIEDNRSSSFWLLDDLALQTIEDRLAMYEKWKDRRAGGMDYYREFEDRIRRLEDTDGNGVADTSIIFSAGYRDPLDGTAAGLLARDGAIYFTNIPSVYLLRDRDDDGHADEKTVLSTGYGIRTALRGHDMHGLVFGPDGRLYWSIGDRGYHIELPDGQLFHSPNSGAVFRCEPDGSNLEIVHHGLRNPQELAFDAYGNLFTVDNNSDGGDKARLVQIVDGGETGWQMEYQTLEDANRRGPWNQEGIWWLRHDAQPAWALPPVAHITSGPSGFAHYPGWGLPGRYDHHFFICDFRGGASHSAVLSFAVEEDGAGFRMVDEHPFADKVLCTDVDFGIDGRVYIADWGNGWVQNGEGRIYTVEDPRAIDSQTAFDVARIFRQGFANLPTVELAIHLAHVDQRVRLRTQWELVRRGVQGEAVFIAMATRQPRTIPRLHAIWGLGQIGRIPSLTDRGWETLRDLIDDGDPHVRAQTCQVLGDLGDGASLDALIARLVDPSLRVRAFAANALGKIGDATAIAPLVACARANDDRDVVLRHAVSFALFRIGDVDRVLALSDDPSAAVRRVALLTLRRFEDPRIAQFLGDADESLVIECARAIYDVPIAGARAALADLAPRLRSGRTLDDTPPRTRVRLTRELFALPESADPAKLDPTAPEIYAGEATQTARLDVADTGGDLGDRYACRLQGTIEAPVSGEYRFAISSDDQSVLFVSREGDPKSLALVARVDGWVARAVWDEQPGQVSAPIHLVAGEKVRIDARHIEGTGLDHLQIGWQRPDGTWERPIGSGPDSEGNLPLLRRVIAAALDEGGAERASSLLSLAADPGLPVLARREALAALAEWTEPALRERVQGEVRWVEGGVRDLESLQPVLAAQLPALAVLATGSVGADARRLAGQYRVHLPVELNRSILVDSDESVDSRLVALDQLAAEDATVRDAALAGALASESPALRVRARELCPDPEARFIGIATALEVGALEERQGTIASLGRLEDPRADELLAALLDRFTAGNLAPALALDTIVAAETRGSDALVRLVEAWRAALPEGDEIAPYIVALEGGDAARGRHLFRDHPVAQCSRCHIAEGDGGVAGPDLSSIGAARSRSDLLESIILPSAKISEGYSTSPGEPSAMPQVHFALEPSEIRDLIEFLARQK